MRVRPTQMDRHRLLPAREIDARSRSPKAPSAKSHVGRDHLSDLDCALLISFWIRLARSAAASLPRSTHL